MSHPKPTEAQLRYHHNMIKGRIAETLIQEMFLSLGFEVYHYGMEHTVPGIIGRLNGNDSKTSRLVRNTPDFLVLDPRNKEVFLVEVKFRASGEFKLADLPENYAYPEAFLIIVSKKHIKCLSYKELKLGKCIEANCRNYLGYRKEFNLDTERVREFCEFAVQFFAAV